jgi:hypothetical protein
VELVVVRVVAVVAHPLLLAPLALAVRAVTALPASRLGKERQK